MDAKADAIEEKMDAIEELMSDDQRESVEQWAADNNLFGVLGVC